MKQVGQDEGWKGHSMIVGVGDGHTWRCTWLLTARMGVARPGLAERHASTDSMRRNDRIVRYSKLMRWER